MVTDPVYVKCFLSGLVIYLGYGVWHSKERRAEDQEVILYDVSDKDNMIVDGVYRWKGHALKIEDRPATRDGINNRQDDLDIGRLI